MRVVMLAAAAVAVMGALPASASAHAERWTHFPDDSVGAVPAVRTSGPSRVVCKPDSAERIRRAWAGRGPERTRIRRARLRMLDRCRHRHIQAAVDAARSGDRILVMPGVYREEPSRAQPVDDPRCSGDGYMEPSGDGHVEGGMVPTFRYQHDCPNSRSLVAIIGDSLADEDRTCDRRCNLQIEGMGRRARDTLVQGDRRKHDVIRADRADGFVLHNLTVEQGAYNSVDVVEANGFRLSKLVARWAKNYGILTFTSDHGLYERIEAYGNGDSGIYPGSGPEGHCNRYGIEIRHVNSYGNTLGQSGTAGNGTWIHHSRFHHNGAGIAADSFAPGHPGMPQDCSKWTHNEIHSNNWNVFEQEHQAFCNRVKFEDRPKETVCPQFIASVGSGFMLYGVNRNIVENNRIYDQWRSGLRLFWVPATLRGENDPAKQADTSNGNRILRNVFGVRPDGTPDPNRIDVVWDEQGIGNCWGSNTGPGGGEITSDPAALPGCATGGSVSPVSNPLKTAGDAPCATWHPRDNPDPPGCPWFVTPAEPQP